MVYKEFEIENMCFVPKHKDIGTTLQFNYEGKTIKGFVKDSKNYKSIDTSERFAVYFLTHLTPSFNTFFHVRGNNVLLTRMVLTEKNIY